MLFLVSVVALAVVVLVTMAPAGSRAPSFTAALYRRGGVGVEQRAPARSGARCPDSRGVAVERLGPISTIGAWVALSSLGWYLLFFVFVAR